MGSAEKMGKWMKNKKRKHAKNSFLTGGGGGVKAG